MTESTMDYGAMEGFVNKFKDFSEILKTIITALTAAIYTLRAIALVSHFSTAALQHYLSTIKKYLQGAKDIVDELVEDLQRAISERKEADDAMVGIVGA